MFFITKNEPKYIVISRDLRNKIHEGVYPIHERLPDGNSLAKDYSVSLMTMKRALDLLAAEGYIIRRRGDGTIVTDWRNKRFPPLYSLKGTHQDYPEELTTEVLLFNIVHPVKEVAEKLAITEEDFAYEIIRLRSLQQKPIIIEYTYMPVEVIPGLKLVHLQTSIYQYIQETLKRKIHSAFVKVTGVRPSAYEQTHMQLSKHDFLMQVERVCHLDDCRVFEYSTAKHIPEVFDFETVLFNN